MKKIIATVALFCIMSCDVKIEPRDVRAKGSVLTCSDHKFPNCIVLDRKTLGGMEYLVFSSLYTDGGVYVVNLTKEQLEVELLRRKIVEFDRSNPTD